MEVFILKSNHNFSFASSSSKALHQSVTEKRGNVEITNSPQAGIELVSIIKTPRLTIDLDVQGR